MNKTELKNVVICAKNGDKKAVERLYTEYRNKLYFFVLKNVGNKDIAEDITEEAFLSSMQSLSTLKNTDSYETWLHSIAYNKCKMYFRNESQNDSISLNDETIGFQYHADDKVMLPEDYTANKELKRHLKKVIDNLKPDMRSAVILYYYDGMSIKEVSEILGISENAVKQKLHKARIKIKKEIEGLFAGEILSAVPMCAMIRNTVSPKYASAAKVSGSALIGNSALALKVIGIAAAGTLAVGVPFALSSAKGNNFGIYNNDESDYKVKGIDVEEDKSSYAISDFFEDTDTDTDLNDSTGETSQSDDSGKIESDSEEDLQEEIPNTTSKVDDISQSDDNSSLNDSSSTENEIDSLNAEKLLNMTLDEALSLGKNQYTMVYPTGVQQGKQDLYKCDDFPEYCFKSNNSDNKIDVINLYNGAKITDNIYIGMTYSELSDILGEEPAVSISNTDLEYSSSAVINGRKWIFSFDLTEEQKNELHRRIESQAADSKAFELNPYAYSVTISDMNPKTYSAVYNFEFQS